ncbi:MAG: hypothetical protein NXH75_03180, partial [Halobacteriovoraceae bacterium]|nr:hypothetical protein [Halobacteriovoraceae bacterium]
SYDRMAGYFSSTSLLGALDGFSTFFFEEGKMRLLCCGVLTQDDVLAIEEGEKNKEEVVQENFLNSLRRLKENILDERLKVLSWLVKVGQLEIKVILLSGLDGRIIPTRDKNGIFHMKVGILKDSEGNQISFSGSVNETFSGWSKNLEEFKVFQSFLPGHKSFIEKDSEKFERYWSNNTKGVLVLPVSEACQKELLSYAPSSKKEVLEILQNLLRSPLQKDAFPKKPNFLKLRNYQEEAVKNWLSKDGK